MRKRKTPLRKKLGLPVIIIETRDGNVYKNYPDKGANLMTMPSILNHLREHDYELTLGNYRKIWIESQDVINVFESAD